VPSGATIEAVPGPFGAMGGEQCWIEHRDERVRRYVSPCLNLSQSTPLCTGALAGSEAQPGSEMTAGGEALDIADNGRANAVLVNAPMPGICRSCWTRTSARVRALKVTLDVEIFSLANRSPAASGRR